MTGCAATHPLAWTQLGARMGYTRSRSQREEILCGTRQMSGTPTTTRLPRLNGPAARVIVTAVFHHCPGRLRQVGVTRLGGGRELVGLEDVLG
ncbi:MAG: hypothetical protein JWM76_4423, partial [Pseudonocardiales bacterium]|nr:hypothetical protein [Pseudonocardiales bacterium]